MIRKMGEFDVLQRTSDSMFNATKLLSQWKKKSGISKDVTDYFSIKGTKELIDTILVEENLHTHKSVYVKSKASRGNNAGTWMSPILFIDFAMWLNPKFKYQVLKFVYDQLIEYRHEAGDNYSVLTEAVARIPNADYRQIAKAIQWIVFNKTGKELRQQATQRELKEIAELEKKVAFMIDMGFVKDSYQLINALRKIYNEKYRKF